MLLFFMVGNTLTTVWIVLPLLLSPTPIHLGALRMSRSLIYSTRRNVVSQRVPFLGSLVPSLGGLAPGELSVSDHSGSMLLATHIERVRISSKSPTMNQRNFIPFLSEFLLYLGLFLISTLSFCCRAGAEAQAPSPTAEEEQELLADPDTIPSSQRYQS